MKPSQRANGFTLIEMMIVVAVIGILGAVAYPMYTDQIRKGKRAEARAALMNLLQQQERYMTQRNVYLEFAVGAAPSSTFKDHVGSDKAKSSHLLGARACQAVSGTVPGLGDCIEVFAEPQTSAFTDAEVTMMAIDTLGRRRCTGTNIARCWQ